MPDDFSPPAPRPPRVEPPSGAKVAMVLIAILAACCLSCVVFVGAYGYFVEIKSLR